MDQETSQEIQNENNNDFNILIEIYKKYQNLINQNQKFLSPQEFVKIHCCDKELFINTQQDEIFKIFFDINSIKDVLNKLLSDHHKVKDQNEIESEQFKENTYVDNEEKNLKIINDETESEDNKKFHSIKEEEIVLTYLILFYVTPEKKDIFFESLQNHKNVQDNILKLLSRNDFLDIISQNIEFFLQNYSEKNEGLNIYTNVLKEIKERFFLINDIVEEIKNKVQTEKSNEHLLDISEQKEEKTQETDNVDEDKIFSVLSSQNVYNVLSSIHNDLLTNGKSSVYFDDKSLNISKNDDNVVSLSASNTSFCINDEQKSSVSQHSLSSTKSYSNKSGAVEVKQTITQILREGAQIRKKAERAEKLLNDICTGAADPFKIHGLLEEVKQQEIEEEIKEIEKKHLLGKISIEEAKLAKLEQLERNKKKVFELKKQRAQLEIKLEEYRQQEERRIRELIEKCHENWEIAKQAQASVLDYKKQIVKSIKEESRRRAAFIEMRRKKELEQKILLIRQFKELEQFAKNTSNTRNSADTRSINSSISIGIPCSMTIEELKKSLADLKKNIEEDLQRRRNKIQEERINQQKLILATKSQIERYKEVNQCHHKIVPIRSVHRLKLSPDLIELRRKLYLKKQKVKNIQQRI